MFFIKLSAQQKDTVFVIFDETSKNQQKAISYFKETKFKSDSFRIINYTLNIKDTEVVRKDLETGGFLIRGGNDITGRFGSFTFSSISNKRLYDSLKNTRSINMLNLLEKTAKQFDSANIDGTKNLIRELKLLLKNQAVIKCGIRELLSNNKKVIKLSTIKTIADLKSNLGGINCCVFIIDISEINKNQILLREVLRSDILESGSL